MTPNSRTLYALFFVYPIAINSPISAISRSFFLYSVERNSHTIIISRGVNNLSFSISPNGRLSWGHHCFQIPMWKTFGGHYITYVQTYGLGEFDSIHVFSTQRDVFDSTGRANICLRGFVYFLCLQKFGFFAFIVTKQLFEGNF